MRKYKNINEAIPSIIRNVLINGDTVTQDGYQNIRGTFECKEIINLYFSIVDAQEPLTTKTMLYIYPEIGEIFRYIEKEAQERIDGIPLNPGTSYLQRRAIWDEFLVDGKFHYTYSERLKDNIQKAVKQLSDNPSTRQCYIPIFTPEDFDNAGHNKRIPCSLGYNLKLTEITNKDGYVLTGTYIMRSCDVITHMPIDLEVFRMILDFITNTLNGMPGGKNIQYTTMNVILLNAHLYTKDITTSLKKEFAEC